MPTVNLGKVGMTLKGVYDNEVQYEKLDVVYYDDSTYCAKVSTQGNLPTDETYWQLLVAPNPLATWKPNTKDDEGYVQKGDGNADSLWATDSQGNPAWVKKDDVATKVEKNSYFKDGIVTKGSGNYDKVWATDSDGAPGWREYYKTTPVYSMNLSNFKYKYTSSGSEDRYLFLFAEVLVPPSSTGYTFSYRYLTFDMSDELLMGKGTNKIIFQFDYDIVNNDTYMTLRHTNNTMPHYPKVWAMNKDNDTYNGKHRFYLGISYYADSYIHIHNVQKSDSTIEVNFRNYLDEENNYIDTARSKQDTSYTYYQMNISASTFYSPISDVAKDTSGIVPAPTSSNANKVFGTDSSGNPSWRELDSNFQYVIDTSKWGTPPSNGYKPIAKFTNNSETSDAKIVFEGLDNIAPDSKEETFYIRVEPNKTSLYRGGASANIAAPYGISGPLPYYIGIFCASNPTSGYNMNVVELYVSSSLPTSSGPISAILFGLRYSGDVTIEWYDIDTSNWVTTPPSGATIRQFTKLALETISGSNDGTVPMPPYKKNTPLIFSALYPYNAYGLPEWRPFSDLSLLTSTEIQEAISTAIASADFSSFEIVEAQPTPETAVENKFYLVKNEDTEHYDIYAKIGETVEWIDDTTVDLTDYATKGELPTSVSELTNDANYTSLTDEQYSSLIQLLGEE